MKIRNPFYLPFALLLAGCVAVANHNGWSLFESVAARTWRPHGPMTLHK